MVEITESCKCRSQIFFFKCKCVLGNYDKEHWSYQYTFLNDLNVGMSRKGFDPTSVDMINDIPLVHRKGHMILNCENFKTKM